MRNFLLLRIERLRTRIGEQRAWIAEHGGTLAGYIQRYGDPGLAECYGNGGTAIYKADSDELARLEAEAWMLSGQRFITTWDRTEEARERADTESKYRSAARAAWETPGEVEFDELPALSHVSGGCWVEAWIYIDKELGGVV